MNRAELSFMARCRVAVDHFFLNHGRKFVIILPYLWLILFFVIPFLIIFKISFSEMMRGVPPYTHLFTWKEGLLNISLYFNSYLYILEEALDVHAYAESLKIGALLAIIILFVRQCLRLKAKRKLLSFHYVVFSFILISVIFLIVFRLISWLNFSIEQIQLASIALILAALITVGMSFFHLKRTGEHFAIKQSIWNLIIGCVVLFFIGDYLGAIDVTRNSIMFNDVLDKGFMSLSLIHAPIFNIQTDLSDSIYFYSYLQSIRIALISTVFCILIGYPLAWAISRCSSSNRNILLLLILLPSWTSFLIRIYAWTTILRNNGLLNSFLMYLGLIDQPLAIMNTNLAVYIGIVYVYLPFVVLPIYNSLIKIDQMLIEAAADLGCKPFKTFFSVILPLTKSGVIAGAMLVFIPVVGEYVIPELLGGSDTNMIGKVLWDEFFRNRDWPIASAVASVMLLILIVPIYYFNKQQNKEMEGR